jgi:glutamyl-tRNA reductase
VSVVVIGLNHRTAPLELLERMAVSEAQMPKALHDLCSREHVTEGMVLSTCNRTEVYAVAERFHGAYSDIRGFLSELSYLPPDEFADHLYVHYDSAAAAHLLSVTAGIDSAVLGETEIQGQVKLAWQRARDEGATGRVLNLLVRHALEAGKRARTETGIGRNIASVSQAAVAMADDRLDGLAGRSVLVVGAGEMGEGMAVALAGAGVAEVRVANRTAARASALAARVGGRAVPLAEFPNHLADVDLVLTSTGSPTLLLEQGDLVPVMAARPDRPLLVVDIAMPRDVEPAVRGLANVRLIDLDDLERECPVDVSVRQAELRHAETLAAAEAERIASWLRLRSASPAIAELRTYGESIRRRELLRSSSRLKDLTPEQLAAVEALTNGIVNKLLHGPTLALRDAATRPSGLSRSRSRILRVLSPKQGRTA